MKLVVDASVVATWFVAESLSRRALELLLPDYEMIAPDHLQIEVHSVLLRALRRGRLAEADVDEALATFDAAPISYEPTRTLLGPALAIARRHGGSLYDAIYLRLAQAEGIPLITDDGTQAETATAIGVQAIKLADLPAGEGG